MISGTRKPRITAEVSIGGNSIPSLFARKKSTISNIQKYAMAMITAVLQKKQYRHSVSVLIQLLCLNAIGHNRQE